MRCVHVDTRFSLWPQGYGLEVCTECGRSREHWKQGESDWILVEDMAALRAEIQAFFDMEELVSNLTLETLREFSVPLTEIEDAIA